MATNTIDERASRFTTIRVRDEDVLKCCGCNLYMIPPIFICKNGHRSCKECRLPPDFYERTIIFNEPALKCRICRANNDLRDREKEDVAYFRTYPCRYSNVKWCLFLKYLFLAFKYCWVINYLRFPLSRWAGHSCTTEALSYKMRFHEYNCLHRIYTCMSLDCNISSRGIYNLLTHLRLIHLDDRSVISPAQGNYYCCYEHQFPVMESNNCLMVFDGDVFVCNVLTDAERQYIKWKVYLCGRGIYYRGRDFKVRLDMKNDRGTTLRSYWFNVVPYSLALHEINMDIRTFLQNNPINLSKFSVTIVRHYPF